MNNTRAQGMSVNIIIIAAIALIILVILVVLVIQSGGDLRTGATDCTVGGGQCYPSWEGCPSGSSPNSLRSCPTDSFNDAQICCMP